MLGNEQPGRPILPLALGSIRANGGQRIAGRERHHRRRDRLRQQGIKLGRVAGLEPRLEVAPVFLNRHRHRRDQACAMRKRHPCHQPVSSFGER